MLSFHKHPRGGHACSSTLSPSCTRQQPPLATSSFARRLHACRPPAVAVCDVLLFLFFVRRMHLFVISLIHNCGNLHALCLPIALAQEQHELLATRETVVVRRGGKDSRCSFSDDVERINKFHFPKSVKRFLFLSFI